jgi:hypothetical protein
VVIPQALVIVRHNRHECPRLTRPSWRSMWSTEAQRHFFLTRSHESLDTSSRFQCAACATTIGHISQDQHDAPNGVHGSRWYRPCGWIGRAPAPRPEPSRGGSGARVVSHQRVRDGCQVHQPPGRVPGAPVVAPVLPPRTPVVLVTPPVIRAIRPVMVLVGMAWLGLAKTTFWPAVRPWVTWV